MQSWQSILNDSDLQFGVPYVPFLMFPARSYLFLPPFTAYSCYSVSPAKFLILSRQIFLKQKSEMGGHLRD